MIHVFSEQVLSLFFVFWFILLAFLWFREERRQMRNSSEWLTGKNRLFLCDKCHLTFLAEDGQSVSRCPRCNDICFLHRRKRF